MASKLKGKQARFVEEYLIDLNASAAYLRAGYKSKNPDVDGHQLLVKPSIKEAIDMAMAERSRRTGISQDRVINELAKIAFADMRDFATWHENGVKFHDSEDLTADNSACISEVSEIEVETDYGTKRTRKIKLFDKLSALEKLGKHLGMFKDKLELSGNVGVKIVDDIND